MRLNVINVAGRSSANKKGKEKKGKEEYLYSAFIQRLVSRRSDMDHTVFTCKLHHTCLSFVSVHQMAPLWMWWRTSNWISLLIYRPETMKGLVGLVGWPIADAYPHKWSPVSYRSSTGRRKNADQRLTFYHWATQANACVCLSFSGLIHVCV